MDTKRTVKKLTEWEPCSSRPVGRPRSRWLETGRRRFKGDESEKLETEV
jgi:hypothetical protein